MSTPDTLSLRVLSLNMWGIPFAAAERRYRVAAIARCFETLPVDVVGLQEAWLPSDRARIIQAAVYSGLTYSHYFRSGLVGSGLLLLSRYRITKTAFHRFRLGGWPEKLGEGDYYAGKGISLARLQTPGGDVDVYNTHTVAQYIYDDARDPYRGLRSASAYEITRFVAAQSPEGYPIIVTGDFNMRPEQPATAILRHIGGLTDCWATLKPDLPGFTYDTANPYVTAEHAERIDYIYARNAAVPTRAEIALTCVVPIKDGLPRAYSDHYGLLVELTIGQHEPLLRPDPPPTTVEEVSHHDVLHMLDGFLQQTDTAAHERLVAHRKHAATAMLTFLVALLLLVRSTKRRAHAFLTAVTLVVGAYTAFEMWLAVRALPDECRAITAMRQDIRQ